MPPPPEPIKLIRDCEVVQIPEGFRVRLARGTTVRITQSLGDTYTVATEYGTLVRIDGRDADAIGLEVRKPTGETSTEKLTTEEVKERVWTALRGVYDPEIPVNVVDLGLVYTNEVTSLPDEKHKVNVTMTLTAPGCGMGGVLKDDAERRIRDIPTVSTAQVDIVVDPPWSQDMMSEAAKLELGLA